MTDLLSQLMSGFDKKILMVLPKILLALFIFVIFWIVAKGVKKLILKLGKNGNSEKIKIVQLLGSFLKFSIIIIGLITSLETLGVDVTAMIAGLGLTGFALSFALKDALSNLLAGILIIFYQPFRSGDKILVSGCEGTVIEINLRYTKLEGMDKEYLIPNSTCFNNWIAISK